MSVLVSGDVPLLYEPRDIACDLHLTGEPLSGDWHSLAVLPYVPLHDILGVRIADVPGVFRHGGPDGHPLVLGTAVISPRRNSPSSSLTSGHSPLVHRIRWCAHNTHRWYGTPRLTTSMSCDSAAPISRSAPYQPGVRDGYDHMR